MRYLLAALMVCTMTSAAVAEPRLALQTDGQRRAADIASWVTYSVLVGLDAKASWDTPNRGRAFAMQGVRLGVTYGAVLAAKRLVHRARPCAPACGADLPYTSFFSGHTAGAFQTLGGPRLAIALPLTVGTGGLRIAADKHWPSDVLVGAGVGLLTSRIR